MKHHSDRGAHSPHGQVIGLVLALAGSWSCRSAGVPLTASWPETYPTALAPSTPPTASVAEPEAPHFLLPRALRIEAAEEAGYEWPHLSLSLGAQLIADVNTTLRVDSETLGRGTEIDLESDFDVDDSLFFGRIDASWRMARKHELNFSLFELDREGTRVTKRQIQIGNTVFPINTRVTNEFETLVVKLAYRYAILHRPRWHMGLSLGAHTMNWDTKWTAGGLALEEDFGFLVPLPVLGLFGSYAFTPRLYLNGSSEFFGLEFEEFDGFLNNTRLNLEHRTFEHLALGVGLEYFLINASVESESGRLSAEAEYDYLGLQVFATLF